MAVEVQRDSDLAVAEHLANYLWVDALLQEQGRGTVSQVMEANVGQAGER
jgi:hypothetical protein